MQKSEGLSELKDPLLLAKTQVLDCLSSLSKEEIINALEELKTDIASEEHPELKELAAHGENLGLSTLAEARELKALWTDWAKDVHLISPTESLSLEEVKVLIGVSGDRKPKRPPSHLASYNVTVGEDLLANTPKIATESLNKLLKSWNSKVIPYTSICSAGGYQARVPRIKGDVSERATYAYLGYSRNRKVAGLMTLAVLAYLDAQGLLESTCARLRGGNIQEQLSTIASELDELLLLCQEANDRRLGQKTQKNSQQESDVGEVPTSREAANFLRFEESIKNSLTGSVAQKVLEVAKELHNLTIELEELNKAHPDWPKPFMAEDIELLNCDSQAIRNNVSAVALARGPLGDARVIQESYYPNKVILLFFFSGQVTALIKGLDASLVTRIRKTYSVCSELMMNDCKLKDGSRLRDALEELVIKLLEQLSYMVCRVHKMPGLPKTDEPERTHEEDSTLGRLANALTKGYHHHVKLEAQKPKEQGSEVERPEYGSEEVKLWNREDLLTFLRKEGFEEDDLSKPTSELRVLAVKRLRTYFNIGKSALDL
jgi:hypothetical protein